MREIRPGLWHYTAFHPGIRSLVHSYLLAPERVLIDPMLPEAGLRWLAERGEPETIVLTNRHHYRASGELREAFGCRVLCNSAGLHEFRSDQGVEGFALGDALPGGIRALEVGAICPDETALWLGAYNAVAIADGIIRRPPDGPLCFVPDQLLGGDPEAVKQGLKAAYGRILDGDCDFDTLLFAHGAPVESGGREALAGFVAGEPQSSAPAGPG